MGFGDFLGLGRKSAPSDYITLLGFQPGPTKVAEVRVLQLLQMLIHGQTHYYFFIVIVARHEFMFNCY
jgi:hypothetical protein